MLPETPLSGYVILIIAENKRESDIAYWVIRDFMDLRMDIPGTTTQFLAMGSN
jgi:hypothetical protein